MGCLCSLDDNVNKLTYMSRFCCKIDECKVDECPDALLELVLGKSWVLKVVAYVLTVQTVL